MRGNEDVTRLRREQVGVDEYRNPIYGDVPTDLPAALFAPGGTSEPAELGRTPVVAEPSLYWPGQWPDVTEKDRLRVRGDVYTVEGRPAAWRRPSGAQAGLMVTLRRAE